MPIIILIVDHISQAYAHFDESQTKKSADAIGGVCARYNRQTATKEINTKQLIVVIKHLAGSFTFTHSHIYQLRNYLNHSTKHFCPQSNFNKAKLKHACKQHNLFQRQHIWLICDLIAGVVAVVASIFIKLMKFSSDFSSYLYIHTPKIRKAVSKMMMDQYKKKLNCGKFPIFCRHNFVVLLEYSTVHTIQSNNHNHHYEQRFDLVHVLCSRN